MTNIVLVEDDHMNRDLLSRRLTNQGYDVRTAENAREGLRAIRNLPPDLVLMDLSLPDRNGWEIAEELKDDPETNTIPIVAITAHATKQKREQALNAGCDAYESKPIDFDRLLEKMDSVMGQEAQ